MSVDLSGLVEAVRHVTVHVAGIAATVAGVAMAIIAVTSAIQSGTFARPPRWIIRAAGWAAATGVALAIAGGFAGDWRPALVAGIALLLAVAIYLALRVFLAAGRST